MPSHEAEHATLILSDDAHPLDDAAKGRLVLRYIAAYIRQRIIIIADHPCTQVTCIFLVLGAMMITLGVITLTLVVLFGDSSPGGMYTTG